MQTRPRSEREILRNYMIRKLKNLYYGVILDKLAERILGLRDNTYLLIVDKKIVSVGNSLGFFLWISFPENNP